MDGASGLIITSVRPKPGNPALVVVRAGRRVLAVVSRADAGRLDLNSTGLGMAADEQLMARLAGADEYRRGYAAVAKWLNAAPLSRAVVEKKAAGKGFSHELIQRLLAEFTALGLIDDGQLAAAATEAELHRRPAGAALLADKLRRRGIEDDVAESAAEQATAGRDLLEDAIRLCRSRSARGGLGDGVTARRRLFGLLSRRGFEPDVVAAALDVVVGPEREAED